MVKKLEAEKKEIETKLKLSKAKFELKKREEAEFFCAPCQA